MGPRPGWMMAGRSARSSLIELTDIMMPRQPKLLRIAVWTEATIRRVYEGIGRPFLSKTEAERRAGGRFESWKRREVEAERLDRLRHPSDYQGR